MTEYNVPEITKDVFYVGAKDWDRRLFDALIPLPQGTTYNAYLVKGNDKTVLIDTVNPGFEKELEDKINQVTELEEIDYIVMNHAEPDHAGSIPYLMEKNSKASLITTEKGAKMAQTNYHVPMDRIKIVKDGEELNVGGKTLRFIYAPWLHWPETMFTYLIEDKILFPCDFFGQHTAFGFYEDDVEELIPFAKRYFGEIMMPLRPMASKAIEKIKDLEIDFIAPSHGPIYRNPEKILDAYRKWTSGETAEKVIVAYVSMWNSTRMMIKTMVETLSKEGINVCLYDLTNSDVGDIAKDLVDSRGIVLGTPTVLGNMHPLALYAAYLVKILRPPLKFGALVSSYGWGGGALRQASELLKPTKIEVVGTLEVNGPPTHADSEKIAEIGRQLSMKVKGG